MQTHKSHLASVLKAGSVRFIWLCTFHFQQQCLLCGLCGYIFILLFLVSLPTHHHMPPIYTHECAAIPQALRLPHCLACTCASSHPCCVYWLLGCRNLGRNCNYFQTPGGHGSSHPHHPRRCWASQFPFRENKAAGDSAKITISVSGFLLVMLQTSSIRPTPYGLLHRTAWLRWKALWLSPDVLTDQG